MGHVHDELPRHGGRFENILDAIGYTPLVEIPRMSPNPAVRIFAKLEMFNPTGSVKDRVANYLIDDLETRGLLHEDSIILEPTSGNTGIALAMIGRRKGYRVALVMPDNVTNERRQMAALFGAEVIDSPGALGSNGAIALAKHLVSKDERFVMPYQYGNPANPQAHYETTGPEILADCPEIDVFVAGLGTSGTLMGVSRYLREHKPGVRIVAAEPLPGELVQGLRSLDDGFIPEILDPALIDTKYLVSNRDAIAALRELVFREGIFAGPSCGAVLVAAARVATEMTSGTIVALLPDGGWKYLSAGTFATEPRRDGGGARRRRELVVTEGVTTVLHEADDPRRIVADGYDAIAERYFAWSDARPSPPRLAWLARTLERVPAGSEVLDLGCGAGVPMTRALADGRAVTGVDISARQIELARAAVPGARFIHADMTGLDLPSDSLDAVVAYYSLTHVPRADQPGLLAAIHAGSDRAACWSRRWARRIRPTRSSTTGWAPRCSSATTGRRRTARSSGAPGSRSSWRSSRRSPRTATQALFLWVIARKPAEPSPMPDDPGQPSGSGRGHAARGHPRGDRRPCPGRVPERGVRHHRRRPRGGGRRPGAPVRADAQRGGLAAALPDRRRAAAPPDDRDRRRGRGVLGHRPLARALTGGAVADRHRPGDHLSRPPVRARLAQRRRGGCRDRRAERPGVADPRRRGRRGRPSMSGRRVRS